MARIRSFKPEFFRHEKLQDLELENPGKYPMLVFEGLWSLCDKNGVFLFKPRHIKLDILPFLPFDMAETLKILEDSNFIIRYTVDNKEYGYIPTFLKHQRISGEEGKQPAKYPLPPNDAGQTQEGRRSDAGQTQEGSTNVEGSCPGKGKGIRERERERKPESPPFQPFVKISGETTEKDFAMIFEEVKSKWKEAIGQETKETLFTVSPVKRERFINTLAAYSLADIFNAIGNYRIVRNDPERYDPGGRIYGNLIGFLENGVSQFFKDEAVEFNFKRRKT